MAEAENQGPEEAAAAGDPQGDPTGGLSDEQRAQLEEEIRQVRVEDVVLQSAVSILNLAARRIAKEDERDLAQAKVGIDAARALTELSREDAQPQLRQAVSELQLLYAKHAGEGEGEEQGAAGGGAKPAEGEAGEAAPKEAGGKGDSPLWTPPGS